MAFNPQTATPREILAHVCKHGKITLPEVECLERHLTEDWVISKEEAELLFRMNDHLQAQKLLEWESLFVSAISRFVVFDLDSPGKVDAQESRWLIDQLKTHHAFDRIEHALLADIAKNAPHLEPELRALIKSAGLA